MITKVQFRVRKTADGYEGMFVLPTSVMQIAQVKKRMYPGAIIPPGLSRVPLAVKSKPKESPGSALASAAKGALALLDNPLIKAAMPPQAAAALKAAGMAADLIKSGAPEAAIKAAGKAGAKILDKLKFW